MTHHDRNTPYSGQTFPVAPAATFKEGDWLGVDLNGRLVVIDGPEGAVQRVPHGAVIVDGAMAFPQ